MKSLLLLILSSFAIPLANAQIWDEITKIVASDRAAIDHFGSSVSISGTYAIVGAYGENGDAGSAYIFEQDANGDWNQVQKIVASVRSAGDFFGWDVSISGTYAIVGAYEDDEDPTEGNYRGGAGSAYVYERDTSGNWNQVQKIGASDRWADDNFGYSVSIKDSYAIVGAVGENRAGAAYLYERDSVGNWNEVKKMIASDRVFYDLFGRSVSVSGDFVIVGAYEEDNDVSGGNFLSAAGSVYMFERDGSGNWSQIQKVVASDRAANDNFGYSVSISGDEAMVGAARESGAGSVYVLKRDTSGNWSEVQKIVSSDRASNDRFGHSVSINADQTIVGAFWEDEDTAGANTLSGAGSAYLFERDSSGNWYQIQKIVASDRDVDDIFSWSVSISSNQVIVGAMGEAEDVSGGSTKSLAGSAYLFCLSTSSTINPVACDSYTSPSGNYVWTSSGLFMDTVSTVSGCDSIITVNLLIKNNTSNTISPTECYSYTSPSGNYVWDSSGIYLDTIPNSVLCDSVITINLTIQNTSDTLIQLACDNFTSPSGNYLWDSSGIYFDTIQNANLCDSLITIDLTINYSTIDTISPTACFSYKSPSGNHSWDSTGIYMDTIPNAAGCDSIVTVDLTINTADVTVTTSDPTIIANATGASYQWLDCGIGKAVIVGETARNFTATSNGEYAVEVTENGCIDTSECITITKVNIEGYSLFDGVSIFPNPTDGIVNIDLGALRNVSVKAYTISGQVLYQKENIRTGIHQFEFDVAPGVYFIELSVDGEKWKYKLVKE